MRVNPHRNRFANRYSPIGIIAGSGPEAGVDLWNKVLLASRAEQGEAYRGDLSAPLVRVISDPALGLDSNTETEGLIDNHLEACLTEISATSSVFTIACNALQAQARRIIPAADQAAFLTFDRAVEAVLEGFGINSLFLIGSSTHNVALSRLDLRPAAG